MRMKTIVKQSIAGTTIMTAFSYLLSAASGSDYREPRLLATMLRRLGVKPSYPAGWLAHFAAGIAWAPVLHWMANRLQAKPRATKVLALGLSSGIAAIFIWKSFFALHPNPPKNKRKAFYAQLVLAHMIFSLPFVTDRSPRPLPPQTPAAEKL